MLDELKEEGIVNKVGGRFKLSTLIQKRLVAINAGSRPLVDLETDNKLQIVIREIMEDKIYLDASSQVKITGQQVDALVAHDEEVMHSQVNLMQDGDGALACCHRCHQVAFPHHLHPLQHCASLSGLVLLAGLL